VNCSKRYGNSERNRGTLSKVLAKSGLVVNYIDKVHVQALCDEASITDVLGGTFEDD